MQYTIQDLELVLNNDDLMSYVYFAYNGGYFIIGRDEDIDADDNPRLMTLEKDDQIYSIDALPEAVHYEVGEQIVKFALSEEVATAIRSEHELTFMLPNDADVALIRQILVYVFSEE